MTYKPIDSPQSQITRPEVQLGTAPQYEPYPPTPAHDELTEEERVEYEKGILTWSKVRNWRFWIRKEWIWYYVLFVLLVVVVALMAFFHHSVGLQLRSRTRMQLISDHQLAYAFREEVTAIEIRMVDPRCDPICPLVPAIIRK
jgi:hypothetical protein